MPKYTPMYVASDGEVAFDNVEFDTIDKAWEHAADRGSRWYFYPFDFVVTASKLTIADAIPQFEQYIGKRVKTVKAAFRKYHDEVEIGGEVDD